MCLETYSRYMCWRIQKNGVSGCLLLNGGIIPHSPHELLYGQKPPLHIPYLPRNSVVDALDRTFAAREAMVGVLKHNLHCAANMMKQKADLRRSDRGFQIGQWVFLKLQPCRQISATARNSEKLAPRYYGPYRILEKVGPVAYYSFQKTLESSQHFMSLYSSYAQTPLLSRGILPLIGQSYLVLCFLKRFSTYVWEGRRVLLLLKFGIVVWFT